MSGKKLKVKTDKKYSIDQCRLYRVTSLKKLCEILGINNQDLKVLIDKSKNSEFYHCYVNQKGRLIQEPINLMYRVHNRIANLLSRVETPSYIHYSKKGCSHISNAKAHLHSKQLITFDIKSYYQNIGNETIRKFFRDKLKCEQDVAYILSIICSFEGSLPTGSQISVYLCNLVNLDMFQEMYLQSHKAQQQFTVYADDITISGQIVNDSHYNVMKKIIERYGYTVKEEKTKRYNSNQIPIVTGIALKNTVDVKNVFYKESRKLCENININIDNEPYAQLKDKYLSLKGKAQYIKQLNKEVPYFILQTQMLLEKKLEGQI
ncbi:reverse transcriptase family protein [Psychrobacter aquaticus]|uniref:Reverse transcriptase domain-containing protein n=1 Tax=Psychrobacter aquaticus CMS 56 TaxID=1354303 RepID=U4T4T7_9GAMM|nr:reverse transcriptase family protein [Psychrobacter aquaticus]ERL56382.1 hypothetical protein M917_0660 [Psychrobacter aquaticus CMS 56]